MQRSVSSLAKKIKKIRLPSWQKPSNECPYAKAYYKHKLKESGISVLATKALGSKLARASYYMLKNDVDYDPEKAFIEYRAEAQALIQKEGRGSKPEQGTGSGSGSKPQGQKPITWLDTATAALGMVILTDFNDIGKMWKCSAHTMSHKGTGLRVLRLQKAVKSIADGVKDFKSQRFWKYLKSIGHGMVP